MQVRTTPHYNTLPPIASKLRLTVASYTPYATQYFTRVEYQELKQELIKKPKSEQEQWIAQTRSEILTRFILDALENFRITNKGQVPQQIVIYRDGVGGPSMQEKVLEMEGPGG